MAVRVAVLGLGEAGTLISRDLVAVGAVVTGYDPVVRKGPDGVEWRGSEAKAAEGADIILSVNASADALNAFNAGIPGVAKGAVWADLNTSAAGLKQQLAGIAAKANIHFVDVAMMAPVPGKGLKVPMYVSGTGSASFIEQMTPLGAVITHMEGPAGTAATRKLLRSVFFKGLAAAVCEAVAAARVAGCEEWLRDNMGEELRVADRGTIDHLIDGSVKHAKRRHHEMEASAELVTELGVEPRIAGAARDWLEFLDHHPDYYLK